MIHSAEILDAHLLAMEDPEGKGPFMDPRSPQVQQLLVWLEHRKVQFHAALARKNTAPEETQYLRGKLSFAKKVTALILQAEDAHGQDG